MRWWMVLWAALAAVVVPSVEAAAADLVEETDRLGENILVEAEAILALASAIRAEVDGGRITLSAEAEASWASGASQWAQIRELARGKQYGPAYKVARQARAGIRMAFRESFTGKPSSTVTDALRAYVEAIGPRAAALTLQIENYPLTQVGRESYHVGTAMWKDAATAAKKKQWDTAFRFLADALAEMDKVIYEAYPTAR